MLAQTELDRGEDFKRLVRAAAALVGLYDDTALADAIGRQRQTVSHWWTGAQPKPDALVDLAETTGLDFDELFRYVYRGGPVPRLVQPGSPADQGLQEGLRQGLPPPPGEGPEQPEPSPRPRPGETE